MKKNKIILFLAAVLAIVVIFLIWKNKKGTMEESLTDFAVSDTASITKIFLADKNNRSITLQKNSNSTWTVNGKYKARPDGVKTLLGTIKNLAVKTRVAKSAYNNVIKGLAAGGVKCEIYQHDEKKPMKVYYVGGSTADVLGTFMLLENSSLPCVIEIPGFQGYLTTRYSTLEENWRDRCVFDYVPEEIKKIEVNYYRDPSLSFSIEKMNHHYMVSSTDPVHAIKNIDTLAVFSYLAFFKYLCFENWVEEFSEQQRDSLKMTLPLNTITVTNQAGVKSSMTTYPRPIKRSSLAQADSEGNPLKYDMDKLFAFINEGNDFVLIQYYVFGKIFRQKDDFDLDKRKNSNRKTGK